MAACHLVGLILILGAFTRPLALSASPAATGECLREPSSAAPELDEISRAISARVGLCDAVPRHGQLPLMGGRLSPFWAQELIGADLVQQEFPRDQGVKPARFFTHEPVDYTYLASPSISPELADCRNNRRASSSCVALEKQMEESRGLQVSGSTSHGVAVAQLVADSVASAGGSVQLVQFSNQAIQGSDLHGAAVNQALAKGAQLLCASQSLSHEAAHRSLEAFHQAGGINILSSGNDFPFRTRYENPNISLLVGSLSPTGLMSSFSTDSPNVAIAAPSDHFVLAGSAGIFERFGGTSGAQPLVCGAVANLVALLPGITMEEAREVLVRTAVPTENSRQQPRLNGAGMVNAYAMLRVAERLRKDWPQSRGRIKEADLYDFSRDAAQALAKAKNSARSNDPCEQAASMREARRAWLLSPQSQEAGAFLARAYVRHGYTMNARFVRSLQGYSMAELLALAKDPDVELRNPALRALAERGAGREVFARVLSPNGIPLRTKRDADSVVLAVYGLGRLGQAERAHGLVLELFRQAGVSEEFKATLFDRFGPHVSGTRIIFDMANECIIRAVAKVHAPCVNVGLQKFSEHPFDEEAFGRFLVALDGRLPVLGSMLDMALIELSKRGEPGRAFLRAQLARPDLPAEIRAKVAAALGQ